MSKLAANFGGGNKNTVYHFLRELILEEEYAWFVNQEGRFRINWVAAVERHIEYRAKKNPGFDTSIDRSRASNSFREALLLRCYREDGAKEYKECRKFSENNKVVEREFQLPSRVFHSLFGSSEELVGDQADGNPQVSPDVGTSPDASDTGFEELMDVSDDLLTMSATGTALQGNINREDNVDPSNIESPSQILGISTEDFHLALEEINTDSSNVVQQPGVVQDICSPSGSVKGGIQFHIMLKEALLESDTKGVAHFERVGDASLEKTNPHTFSGFIPAAQEAGRVLVTVYTEAGRKLGVTYFTYVDEVRQVLKQLIKDPAQISLFLTMWSQEHGIIGSSSDVAQTPGLFSLPDQGSLPDTKQVQSLKFLQLLVYTAAQEGAQQFLEVIFSTSAGKIVFNSYKDRTPLPEDVARANGHDKLVEFLQDVNKRLSKESDSNSVTLSTSEWLELVQAVGNVQKQTVSNDEQESSRIQPKDDDNQSDYFADAETSSCGSHDLVGYWSDLQVENEHRLAEVDTSSCGSFEVDSERSDSEDAGSFTQDIKPTEKEFSSLNPPVEPSSEETTQFDQPEDEEKTSFIKTSFQSFIVFKRFLIVSAFFCLIVGGMYLQIPFRSLSSEFVSEISEKFFLQSEPVSKTSLKRLPLSETVISVMPRRRMPIPQSETWLDRFWLFSYPLLLYLSILIPPLLLYTRIQFNLNANSCPNVFPSKRRHTGLKIRPDLLEEEIELFDRRGNRVCASMTVITKKKA